MPNYSLLFARTLQHATDSALVDWQWEPYNELRNQFRRPDNGEMVRWVPDVPSALGGLRFNTRIYLGREWRARRDSGRIMSLSRPVTPEEQGSGFFVVCDPQLPPPRPRKSRDEERLSELKRLLDFRRAERK